MHIKTWHPGNNGVISKPKTFDIRAKHGTHAAFIQIQNLDHEHALSVTLNNDPECCFIVDTAAAQIFNVDDAMIFQITIQPSEDGVTVDRVQVLYSFAG